MTALHFSESSVLSRMRARHASAARSTAVMPALHEREGVHITLHPFAAV